MTHLLVAATGGHLSQLVQLAPRIANHVDTLFVTFDSPQSRSLLADKRHIFIPSVEERDVRGVLRGALIASRLFRRERIEMAVSTGSGVALSFLPLAAAHGIPAHYIESAARVMEPSLTGRLLQRVPGIRLYRQYPDAARGKWRYAGSVFEGFEAAMTPTRPVRRIVVTLGSGEHGFRRLVLRLLAIFPAEVEVLWQTGSTAVGDLPIRAEAMVPATVLDRAIAEADAVIGHAGCGYALAALNSGKLPIVVPRDPRHGELVDNHQIELARFLGEQNLAIAREPDSLTFDDVVAAAGRQVRRRADPPLFALSE
jgi:UDP-N-acetylglucosamine transferase subunit ALG13